MASGYIDRQCSRLLSKIGRSFKVSCHFMLQFFWCVHFFTQFHWKFFPLPSFHCLQSNFGSFTRWKINYTPTKTLAQQQSEFRRVGEPTTQFSNKIRKIFERDEEIERKRKSASQLNAYMHTMEMWREQFFPVLRFVQAHANKTDCASVWVQSELFVHCVNETINQIENGFV